MSCLCMLLVSIWLPFAMKGYAQSEENAKVYFVTPAQLVTGAAVLIGKRIRMEAVFCYAATDQPHATKIKCVIEGKFRTTKNPGNAVVFYNVYIDSGPYLRHVDSLKFGTPITVEGIVENSNTA